MFVVWNDVRSDGGDLYGAIVTDVSPADPAPGTDGQPLVVAPGSQREPAVASVDGSSTFVVAWTDGLPVTQVRALRLGDGIDWGPTGVPVHDAGSTSGSWSAVTRQTGGFGAIVAWTETAEGLCATRVQRLDPTGARQWGANGLPVGTDTTVSDRPQIVAGFGGSAYVLRSDRRNGTLTAGARALALFRIEANGSQNPNWPAEGLVLGSTGAGRYQLLEDGTGGVYVVWDQAVALSDASVGVEVRATRIHAGGTAVEGWSVAGMPVVTRPDGNVRLGQADVASGDLVCALTYDQVVGGPAATGRDLLAQRLYPWGGAGWPAVGLALCTAPGPQNDVRVIGKYGGLLAAWSDDRGTDTDLYGLRLRGDGSPAEGWTAQGTLLCGAPGDQEALVLAPASGPNAVLAWNDRRDFIATQTDVYAQTVNWMGQVDVPPMASGDPALSAPRPQPAASAVSFTLSGAAGEAAIEVLDTQGRRVASWRTRHAGRETGLAWDLTDRAGRRVPPGVYRVMVRLHGASFERRVVVVR